MTTAVAERQPKQQTHTALVPHTQAGPRGVGINSLADLWKFAEIYWQSGLTPKAFTNVQAVCIAVQAGLEIGLSPAQAMQSIAVINGKPGVYGDAAIALVDSSGLMVEIDEYFTVGGQRVEGVTTFTDDTTAVCVTYRAGRKNPVITTFSVADAKRASLWGKSGPWQNYPQRMMKFRARGFNLRDNFADVLRGLKTVEELQDYPEPRNQPAVEVRIQSAEQIAESVQNLKPKEPNREGLPGPEYTKQLALVKEAFKAAKADGRIDEGGYKELLDEFGADKTAQLTAAQLAELAISLEEVGRGDAYEGQGTPEAIGERR